MLISETAKVKWNSRNKKHYVELGYAFTKMGDEFDVQIKDLTQYSKSIVYCVCDYCGKEYDTKWEIYNNSKDNSETKKDCCGCKECRNKKREECCLLRYGVKGVGCVEIFKEKIKNVLLERYGVECIFCSEEMKEKAKITKIKRYGVPHVMQSQEMKEKREETSIKRYGVPHYSQTDEWRRAMSGENNPFWKGNIERDERYIPQYYIWRKNVFTRDCYTCQCCGAKSKKGNDKPVIINAHHIKNWKDNPDDRFDIDNGITLCKDCHCLFHNKYGKHNNTQEQLNEFINEYKLNNKDKNVC